MVHYCSAFGCFSKFMKGGVGFYRFPSDRYRRLLWIKAVRRKNWLPGKESRICGNHFQTGKPSNDTEHPDYVPNIFSFVKGIKSSSAKSYERRKSLQLKRSRVLSDSKATVCKEIVSEAKPLTEDFANSELEMDEHQKTFILSYSEATVCEEIASESKQLTENPANSELKMVNGEASVCEEIASESKQLTENHANSELELEEHQKILIHSYGEATVCEEIASESKKLPENRANSAPEMDEYQKTLLSLNLEIMALRAEKRDLEESLRKHANTNIIEDEGQLHFYTGLPNREVFEWLLSVMEPEISNSIEVISKREQLLMALMKLKLNLVLQDLAYRFKVSRRTVARVLKLWTQPLFERVKVVKRAPA